MKDVVFRGIPLIDREKEITFIKEWFKKTPQEILFIYGPKSVGKTTIIEYIVENELFDDFRLFKSTKYNVKYINFRQKLFGEYDSFLNSLLVKDEEDFELSAQINLGVFKIDAKSYKKIKDKELDLFDELFRQLKESKKRPILIFDEIQALENVYVDKNRLLLDEFLNFCVSLTKEKHLAHVVLLSSNTIFLETLYNNAKLKVTSYFYKIDHLPFEAIKSYFDFSDDEIKLIYDYVGGSIAHIQKIIRRIELNQGNLEEVLNQLLKEAVAEVNFSLIELLKKGILNKEKVKEVFNSIVYNNFYDYTKTDLKTIPIIEFLCEKEILFFEIMDNYIYANSRIYQKAIIDILKEIK
jgi:AAA+ ATPase superfamily predicted ATPase